MRQVDPGARIGRFEIVRLLGAGGMGAVYEARDPELARSVALKLIHEPESHRSKRLVREAQALAQLQHPNVVAVHDVGADGDEVFVAMELVDGTTVDKVTPAPRTWRAVVAMFVQAGHGLVAAHAKGLVHRDIKPSNLLVDRQGRVRVGDFGLARLAATTRTGAVRRNVDATAATVDASDESASATIPAPGATPGDGPLLDAQLTRTGAVVGTPKYMAPELFDGAPASAATDQYSFCLALRELLPADAPRWLVRAVEQGMSRDPAQRHASMAALVELLERTPARRRNHVIAATAGLMVGAAMGLGAIVFARDEQVAVDCHAAETLFERTWSTAHPRVAAALDRHADHWTDTRIDACRATHERGEQSPELLDRRMQCLDRQRTSAQAVIVSSDLTDAAALDVVAGLPDPALCSAKLVSSALPYPDDARVAEINRLLDESIAVRAAGDPATALVRVDAGLALADQLGHPGLRAVLLRHKAEILWETDPATSQRLYQEAHEAAVAADETVYQVWTTIDLLDVAIQRTELQSVEALLPLARAAVKRDGMPRSVQLHFAVNEANALVFLGRYPEALEACRRIEELETEPKVKTTACRCTVQGDEEQCQRAVLAFGDVYGVEHPLTMFQVARLADAIYAQGDYERARELQTQVLTVAERVNGPDSKDAGMALHARMSSLRDLGRFEEARADGERALAIFEKLGLSRAAADTHGGLGQTYAHLGDTKRVLHHADEALRLLEAALGVDHPEMAQNYGIHAVSHAGVGDWEPAVRSIQRCVELATRHFGASHTLTMTCTTGHAELLLELGRFREAADTVERVLATADLSSFRRDNQAAIHGIHGRALLGLGKKREARAAIERAIAKYRELGMQQRLDEMTALLAKTR